MPGEGNVRWLAASLFYARRILLSTGIRPPLPGLTWKHCVKDSVMLINKQSSGANMYALDGIFSVLQGVLLH